MGTAVEAGAAGEEAVAVCDLHDILVGTAGSDDRSSAAFLPDIDVFLCIKSYHALSGSAGSGLDADAFLEVCAEKTVGICFTEVIFAQERELLDIIDTLNVFRLYSFFVHQIAVVGDIVIDMFHLPDDLFVLNFENLLAGRGLDLFLVIVFHGGSFP